jgi:hypothetical protein
MAVRLVRPPIGGAMYDRAKHLAEIQALEDQYRHQLESHGNWLGISVLPGWLPIVRDLFARLDRELTRFERRRILFSQVKQKWGQLRVYWHLDGKLARLHADIAMPEGIVHIVEGTDDPLSEKVDDLIQEAVEVASRTCEFCGRPGVRRESPRAWMSVVCDDHYGVERGGR